MLKLSLEPEKEQEYIDKLNEFEDFEARISKQEKQNIAILQKLREQRDKGEANEATIRDHGTQLKNVNTEVGVIKEDVKLTAAKTDRLTVGLEKLDKKTDALQAEQGTNFVECNMFVQKSLYGTRRQA